MTEEYTKIQLTQQEELTRRIQGRHQEEYTRYIRYILEAYRKTPGTTGTIRRPDRMLAAQLYQRGVSVQVIENALVLAAARRGTDRGCPDWQ
jgi:hypothetical protein